MTRHACKPVLYSLEVYVSDYTWTVIQSLAELRKIFMFFFLSSEVMRMLEEYGL